QGPRHYRGELRRRPREYRRNRRMWAPTTGTGPGFRTAGPHDGGANLSVGPSGRYNPSPWNIVRGRRSGTAPAGLPRPVSRGPTDQGPGTMGGGHVSQRHHPGGRTGDAALSDHPRRQQAAPADLRQTDDLLPAGDADAGGDPRGPGDLDAGGHRRLRAAAG